MKRILICIFFLKSIACFTQADRSFFERQDMLFDSLSTKWEEGAFLGNGLLGVMVYRENANTLRFDLGRTDVTDHREGINPSIGRGRLPIGRFLLHAPGKIQNVQLRLNLYDAELKGTITTDKGSFQLQALVAATKDVMIFKTSKPIEWEWMPEKAISPFLSLGRDSMNKYPPNPDYIISKEGDIHFNHQKLLSGGSYTTAWKVLNNAKDQQLVITITNTDVPSWAPGAFTGKDSKLAAKKILTAISSTNLASIIKSHQDHWHHFYAKSFISIPDSRLESFWTIQQYKIASATRAGAYPIDLMGAWYKASPWPKYWWNLNIQLTYYPFFSSNHVDLAQPLLTMINSNIDNLSKNAPEPYQYNSAALARSGPYDMSSGIKVLKGNDSTGSSSSLELGNLTWLLHVYWQAYEHTADKNVMKHIYPVLTKAINYYINITDKQADGKYHLPFTYSPEYPKGITRDANYDLSVLHWGLKTLIYINDELKLNDPSVLKWKDFLTNLVPYPKDQLGFRVGRDADFSLSHRHYSHLLMVYPIYDINWDQPENRDLIFRSLNQWETNNSAWRGYSYSGAGSIYAMMGNGNKTAQLLNEMIDKGRFAIKPNTMYLEAGPVIETPLSAVTTMNEMLLQSWNNIIRVFPAVPQEWKDASFDKLLAKGAFEVSAVRKNGLLQFVKIKSLAGSPCVVKWSGEIHISGKRKFDLKNINEALIQIDLKKGEEITIYNDAGLKRFNVSPVVPKGKINSWGLPK